MLARLTAFILYTTFRAGWSTGKLLILLGTLAIAGVQAALFIHDLGKRR